ncbi:MAG: alpha/beta hydrolase [Desulfofustis sp.]|nr:alpha/beta hydrolase [Desulfofustis sp.]
MIPKILILVTLIVAGSISACNAPYEEDMDLLFTDQKPTFEFYSTGERTIHYVEVGHQNSSPILFLHGTPGSWTAYGTYLSDTLLADSLNMVAVDRPGFGQSDYGNLVTSLAGQAQMLKPLVDRLSQDCGIVLVGHSLGAPLAVRMAMDYPKKIAALLLVAPSLDPELEKPRWYNILADYKLMSWLLPTELELANLEVMALPDELTQMVPLYSMLDLPITVIQGENDKLVHPENADFAEKMVPRGLRVVRLEDAGHFVLWQQPELIKKEILNLYEDRLAKGYCVESGQKSSLDNPGRLTRG